MTTINEVATIMLTVDAFTSYLLSRGVIRLTDAPYKVVPITLTREDIERIKEDFMAIVHTKAVSENNTFF